jgi:hypothetical protein
VIPEQGFRVSRIDPAFEMLQPTAVALWEDGRGRVREPFDKLTAAGSAAGGDTTSPLKTRSAF